MGLISLFHGLSTHLLFVALLYGLNLYIKATPDYYSRLYGTIGIAGFIGVLLLAYISRWTSVRTWTFYLTVVPLFLVHIIDNLVAIEKFREPNASIAPELVRSLDSLLTNVYVNLVECFHGGLCLPLSYIVLYRLSNGSSARSLTIFNAAAIVAFFGVFAGTSLTSGINPVSFLSQLVLPAGIAFAGIFVWSLRTPRQFLLSSGPVGVGTKLFSAITVLLLLATIAILSAKALIVSITPIPGPLAIVKLNDPILFLNDQALPLSQAGALVCEYIIVVLPSLFVCLLCQLKRHKPTFVWDLSVVLAAFVLSGQFVFIAGAFYWDTPKELRVSADNTTFWTINLIPVVGVLAQLLSLMPYRVPVGKKVVASVKTKKKRS